MEVHFLLEPIQEVKVYLIPMAVEVVVVVEEAPSPLIQALEEEQEQKPLSSLLLESQQIVSYCQNPGSSPYCHPFTECL